MNKRKNHSKYKRGKEQPHNIVSKELGYVKWRITEIDLHGTHGWSRVQGIATLEDIKATLVNMESMKWGELSRKLHHQIPLNKLISEAQTRFRELGYDDDESLWSFRSDGRPRIWAIRRGDYAFILWWDPKHEICPSRKKHT